MIHKKDFLQNLELKKDKAMGALSGLAIGDSLGDAARTEHNRAFYGITTDFNNDASWSTDDTEFALLTAKIVIDTQGIFTSKNVADIWMNTLGNQKEFRRGGKSEIAAISNLLNGIKPPNSGRFNAFSESDGAAMRVAPIGIICAGEPEKAALMAKEDAMVSHDKDGIWAAQAVAVAVSIAMVDGSIDEILSESCKVIPTDSWLHYNMERALALVEDNDGNVLSTWMKLHDAVAAHYWSASPEAIPATFACLKLMNKSFKEGIILASNYGRDADTIGAVAGAILGAKYGLRNIPSTWVEKTRYPTGTCLDFTNGLDILDLGEKLAMLIE